jgi:hypothetical protein
MRIPSCSAVDEHLVQRIHTDSEIRVHLRPFAAKDFGAEVESAAAGRYPENTPYILHFHQTAGALTDVHD